MKEEKNHEDCRYKKIIVVSDFHLGAGTFVDDRYNFLEEFHKDREFIDLLIYYSSGENESIDLELVINGDFLDFCAVPFVRFFDDEFWSEEASIEKMKLIIKAHQEVFQALNDFVSHENKIIKYIIGNHDAEMYFNSVSQLFRDQFEIKNQSRVQILTEERIYVPHQSILIKHGHGYERSHSYDPVKSFITLENGRKYFLVPWGTFYVTRIVNRFKEERSFINSIRPISTFIIYGLIFDTLFTIRFIMSNLSFVVMVIFAPYFVKGKELSWREKFIYLLKDMELFQDYEMITREDFVSNQNLKLLVVGHTHVPAYRGQADGTTFINTGSWKKMFNLDFEKRQDGEVLTFAEIELTTDKQDSLVKLKHALLVWTGPNHVPFKHFSN